MIISSVIGLFKPYDFMNTSISAVDTYQQDLLGA